MMRRKTRRRPAGEPANPVDEASSLAQRARALLHANTQTAERDGEAYLFSVPSVRAYPFQWFWDSCFHAIVWSRFDPERAKSELRGLFAWQEPDGFIPHVIFWNPARVRRVPWHWHYWESRDPRAFLPWGAKPATSAHIQPPVLAQAVERVVAASSNGFLAEALPVLERYYRWLAQARDPDRDGLISIISQFESGLDYNPAYDATVGADGRRPLRVLVRTRVPELENKLVFRFDLDRIFRTSRYHQEDVLVNSLYAQGLSALARLAEAAGQTSLCAWAKTQAARVMEALLAKCYDPKNGLFWNLAGLEERPIRTRTVISLMPLVLEELPREIADRLLEHLTDPREFWTPYPVPAVSRSEPSFAPTTRIGRFRLIWRGPVSMNTNWFLAGGLRLHGFDGLADEIAGKSRALVHRGGFNEFYNPFTGDPVGAERFGWATLAVDL